MINPHPTVATVMCLTVLISLSSQQGHQSSGIYQVASDIPEITQTGRKTTRSAWKETAVTQPIPLSIFQNVC